MVLASVEMVFRRTAAANVYLWVGVGKLQLKVTLLLDLLLHLPAPDRQKCLNCWKGGKEHWLGYCCWGICCRGVIALGENCLT
jgi:hypothetical protein